MVSLSGLDARLFYSICQEAGANTSRRMLRKRRTHHSAEEQAAQRHCVETSQCSVKVKDVWIAIPATNTAPDTGMRPTTIEVDRKQLETAMAQHCRIYNIRFRDATHTMELDGVAYAKVVEIMFTNSLYNIRRELHSHNFDHDVTTYQAMTSLVNVFTNFMHLGANGHSFCTDIQYHGWFGALFICTECVVENGQEGRDQNVEVNFSVKSNILAYVREKRNFIQHLSRRSANHMIMTGHTLHFWWLGVDATAQISEMNYTTAPLYPSKFTAGTNVASNIPQVGHTEAVFDAPQTASFMPWRLRVEQKACRFKSADIAQVYENCRVVVSSLPQDRVHSKGLLPQGPSWVVCWLWGW